MKKIIHPIAVCLFIAGLNASAQISRNMTKLGQLPYPNPTLHGDVSDIWGYVDSLNNEYAIVGLEKGVSVVNVTNGALPVEVFYQAGASSIWRDIKTWNKHAYITNESSGGLMIIDLRKLPGTIQPSDIYSYTGVNFPFSSAHNLYIDENGVAYIFGANSGSGGAIMLDLSNPKVPVELGRFNDFYLHDGMVRGDTLWGAAVYNGFFAVIDVSSKSLPVTLKTHQTDHNFTHNCWISDNGRTLFTTDEKPGAYIGAYDVSDLNNIQNIDLIQSSPGSNVIPHNTHVLGDFLVTSYYKDGVTIVDATMPDNLVEVGWYDTAPTLSGNGFSGCWGVYPFLPSGKVVASDIENGLFIFDVQYRKGSYVQGKVLQFSDSSAVAGANIQVLNPVFSTTSSLLGSYHAAFADTGLFTFVVTKTGFLPETLQVQMHSGVMAQVDFYLRNDQPFHVKGQISSVTTQQGIASAGVLLRNAHKTYHTLTDANGFYRIDSVYEDHYDFVAGHWLYLNECSLHSLTDSAVINAALNDEIYDDFTFDFGWTTENMATDGLWEREDYFQYPVASSVVSPTEDVSTDCADAAFVTGAYNGTFHNVDGGLVRLISPVFDASGLQIPVVDFSLWCIHSADFNTDDRLAFSLIQGSDTILLEAVSNLPSSQQSTWVQKEFVLRDFLTNYTNLRFMVEAEDLSSNDLLKVAIDKFRVTEGPVGLFESNLKNGINVYPNPVSEVLFFQTDFIATDIKIFDITGRSVIAGKLEAKQEMLDVRWLKKGIYIIRFLGPEEEKSFKFIKD